MAGGDKMNRYARQTCLPGMGEAGQAALEAAHVLVVGAGGLGAPVLQYLAGAGVGRLTLVDGDTVSLTNLHRQTLFRETDIDRPKVEAAAGTLRRLNTDCNIDTVFAPLDPVNVSDLVAQATLVLDCADSFAVSYILSDTCLAAGVPLISASVLGVSGYAGGFCGTAPSLRAIFPDLPDRAASCATAGVMGPVVGMIGAAQAQMALACLTGQVPSPLGQVVTVDMQTYRSSSFRFDAAPEPVADLRFIAADQITASDLVVELRPPDESPAPVCPHARRIGLEAFRNGPGLTPPVGVRTVFACRSGLRAWQAATHLRRNWTGEIALVAAGDTPGT
ncbi:HesA/MoeB/ThiF family protein [Roseovarius sp. SK2]|uniref:HesA/MoeB/ThiF family protein n=1 Tax=Roseovarius TaxID=74030 RepID=UPI000CDD6E8D|nr:MULTISPECIES: HesA/MoeB/ThiF family protein [Roseovarius]MDD9728002.1 HesA/MoeB/ThiF family protein [Roseovarius sp. SK2]